MNLFNLRSPFFLAPWRRVAVVVATLGWALVELVTGSLFWAMLFGGMGAYAGYEFFIVFDPKNYAEPPEDSD